MKAKEMDKWTNKTQRVNQDIADIKRGMAVIDMFGNKGIVVEVFTGHNQEDHGMIAVWQSERTKYGCDNCEHYPYHDWKSILRVVDANE
jgi:hypothetical protein